MNSFASSLRHEPLKTLWGHSTRRDKRDGRGHDEDRDDDFHHDENDDRDDDYYDDEYVR